MSTPRYVSLNQLAAETGYVTRTLMYIRKQEPGVLIYREKGSTVEYEQPTCAVNLRKREVAQEIAKVQPADLDSARARKANAEAEIAELELAKARGQMVTVADYERALGVMCDRFVARLRALPVRLAHLGDAVEAEAEAEAEAIIAELHALDEDVLEVPEGEADAA